MNSTKKITLSAIMVALGTVFMALGSVIEVLDLSVCAVASLIVVFIYLELGSSYAWMVYLATSLAAALVVPSKLMFLEYFLVFGIYPLLKAFIERLPKWSWILVKLVFINAIIWTIFLFAEVLLGIPFIEGDTLLYKAGLYIFMNITFIVYDIFITVMVRFYYDRLRPRFKRFLK